MLPLDLIGHANVPQQIVAHVQRIEVSARRLRAIGKRAPVVRSRFVPVTVSGIDIEAAEFIHVGESIGQRHPQAGGKQGICLPADHAIVLAFRPCLVVLHVIDAASAGDEAQFAADALGVIDRGEPRDGFTGNAVPRPEFGRGWFSLVFAWFFMGLPRLNTDGDERGNPPASG